MVNALILGIIQGATEFLPVSSTAHLVLMRWVLGWEDKLINSLSFDVALHAGTLLSLLICFWRDIIAKENRRLLLLIIIGTVPAGVSGLLWADIVEHSLRSPIIIVTALAVFGGVMIFSEGFKKTRDMGNLTVTDALFVGLAQAVALIPGVSRSGITISAALMLGLKREASARFSFLLSVPVIGGAVLFEGQKLLSAPQQGYDMGIFSAGLLASLLAGISAIKFLMGYLRKHPLNIFAYYRFMLAIIITGWLWFKG